MDVKPWEPVSYKYSESPYGPFKWKPAYYEALDKRRSVKVTFAYDPALYITLANGQRVIVRALSEDRKAARAERKRYYSIVSHPLYKEGQETLNRIQSRILEYVEANR